MKKLLFAILTMGLIAIPMFSANSVEAQGGCYVGSQFVSPCPTGGTSTSSGNENLICRVFPFLNSTSVFNINAICGNISQEAVGDSVQSTISLVTSLIFIVIILLAVFVIVRAAIKYIRSEGDDTKIQEAQKAIKSVFVGIAALFVGIIGIVIVLAFFNVGSALDQSNTTNTGNPLLNSILQ